MRTLSFPYPLDLGGHCSLAALPSVIVQRAPNHHHVIDHSFAPIAKFVSQNSQSLHRREGMFHRDAFAGQSTVKTAASPMQSTSVTPLPGCHHIGFTNFQSLKPTIPQQQSFVGQSQAPLVSYFFIVVSGWSGG